MRGADDAMHYGLNAMRNRGKRDLTALVYIHDIQMLCERSREWERTVFKVGLEEISKSGLDFCLASREYVISLIIYGRCIHPVFFARSAPSHCRTSIKSLCKIATDMWYWCGEICFLSTEHTDTTNGQYIWSYICISPFLPRHFAFFLFL